MKFASKHIHTDRASRILPQPAQPRSDPESCTADESSWVDYSERILHRQLGFSRHGCLWSNESRCSQLARTFTAELKGIGPRVNVISPGPIDTPGNAATLGANQQVREFVTGMVPLGRIGQGVDVARAAVFLACEESAFIAGVELFVDGGLSAV